MNNRNLVIFGSAELAQLARFYFEQDSRYKPVAFTVDDTYVTADSFGGLPLVPFSEVTRRYPPDDHDMFVALSYRGLNQLRMQKYESAKSAGYKLASYLCSKSVTWPDLQLGDNCFILENQTIQPTVRIGDNAMIWSGNHIGHGTVIEDHVYIASHVVISGHCRIGKRSFLGVNATIRDFCSIGEGCFVTMGALVGRDLAAGSVILGADNEILPGGDRRAEMLKRKYFGN